MDATDIESPYYTKSAQFIQQGDIFCIETVTPIADWKKRIFRASDGRHGSVVFDEESDSRIFEETELRETLASANRTELHTEPFSKTFDGQPELVVVSATLTSYFIIVSQTCDISGVDKKTATEAVTILSIQTLKDICRFEKLPIDPQSGDEISIEQFLATVVGASDLPFESDAFSYGEKIRSTVASWNPEKKLAQTKGTLRTYLNNMQKAGYMFPLRSDPHFRVPECFIDFTAAYTVAKTRVETVKDRRIACIGTPYRDEFARAYGNRLSRIATPKPIRPDTY